MSASRRHNLFGLRPSILDDYPTSADNFKTYVRPLQATESRIWRVPLFSDRLIKVIHHRLQKPRRQLFTKPLSVNVRNNNPILTVGQYVRLANFTNRQLVSVAKGELHGRQLSSQQNQRIADFADSFQSHTSRLILRSNDAKLDAFSGDLSNVCYDWLQFRSTLDTARTLSSSLAFHPYYSSFMRYTIGVLTPPAFRLLDFCQDFDENLRDIVDAYPAIQAARAKLPDPHAVFEHHLRLLQISHPVNFTRYHSAAVRQVRFTVLSTVRKLD